MSLSFNWPRVHGDSLGSGVLKSEVEDFQVTEVLPETPCGEGEHLWLTVKKTGQNTEWVARQISKWAGCKPREVSYAGLKDRHAVTEQTFSVHLPGKVTPHPSLLHVEGVEVLRYERHQKKLKTGQLIGNQFKIRVRQTNADQQQVAERWAKICESGVPNYFGPQRFGHDGQNVEKGLRWLKGEDKAPRHHQSIYLSAIRSYLFNEQLAQRITSNRWNRLEPGDFVQFTEGKRGFYCESPSDDDLARFEQGKLSVCGSMPGRAKDDFPGFEAQENRALADYVEWQTLLEEKGLERQFRKFRLFPEQPALSFVEGDPVLTFFLPAGAFATNVLSELFDWKDAQEMNRHAKN